MRIILAGEVECCGSFLVSSLRRAVEDLSFIYPREEQGIWERRRGFMGLRRGASCNTRTAGLIPEYRGRAMSDKVYVSLPFQ